MPKLRETPPLRSVSGTETAKVVCVYVVFVSVVHQDKHDLKTGQKVGICCVGTSKTKTAMLEQYAGGIWTKAQASKKRKHDSSTPYQFYTISDSECSAVYELGDLHNGEEVHA